jgi:hypothetical protein
MTLSQRQRRTRMAVGGGWRYTGAELERMAMSKITLDESLRTKLNGLEQALELCDESGRTIGHFLTRRFIGKCYIGLPSRSVPYSAEEIASAGEETGGHTLEEWKRIAGLFR